MTIINIDQNLFLGVIGFATISALLSIGCIIMFFKIPEIATLMKANFLNRPIIQVHTALKQTKLYAPKLRGKKSKYNIYDIPEHGVKFTPLPDMVEHVGGSRHVNYYSKAALGLDAKAIAAFRDIEELLKVNGIKPTESILDTLLRLTDQEIKELYEFDITSVDNTHLTLSADDMLKIRDHLQKMFIKDGQFVWETAKNFIFLMETETSRSLEESIAIAREQAIQDARLGITDNSSIQYVVIIIALLMGGVIAFKMLTGS